MIVVCICVFIMIVFFNFNFLDYALINVYRKFNALKFLFSNLTIYFTEQRTGDTTMDPDEELAIIILMMVYFYRKVRSASRVPQQVSNFSGHNRMIDLLHGNDRRFVDILRMPKSCFIRLCGLLQQNGVRNTRSLSVEEQVMMFLLVVGHGDSTRRSGYEWHHSTETVSRHFNNICSRIVGLAPQLIGQPDFNNIQPLIANNSRYFPYFRVRTFYSSFHKHIYSYIMRLLNCYLICY